MIYLIVENPHDPKELPLDGKDWEFANVGGTLMERIRIVFAMWLQGRDRSRSIDAIVYYIDDDTPKGSISRVPVTAFAIPGPGRKDLN